MLEQMTQRLLARRTFESAAEAVLNDVVALHGAEYGDLQLVVGDELVIVAQQGLSDAFLRAFRRVRKTDGCACGRAWRTGTTVVVADVTKDVDYAGNRGDAAAAGYRAVQSTPIVTRDGTMLGLISTLFVNAHEPTPIEMETLARYSRVAADHLAALLGRDTLARKAMQMSDALYAAV